MPSANVSSQVLRLHGEVVPDAAEKDRLSDFSWTLHHRHLFLKLKDPVHRAAPTKVHGLRGWVSAAAARVCWAYNKFLWVWSVVTRLTAMVINQEPGAAEWAQLGACVPGFFGAATWEDWRQADVFHLLYDWLLVLLQERLLSPQGAHGASAARYQMLWVGTIATLLLILSFTNLIWSFVKQVSTRGRRKYYVAQRQHAQQLVRADAAPSQPVGTHGLNSKTPSAGVTPSASPNLIPASAAPSPTPDPEGASRQAQLLSMRRALEEAGVETVSRADAHSAQPHTDNALLKLRVSSLSAQLTAEQQGSLYFRKLFFSESRQRVAADRKAKSAIQAAGNDSKAKNSTVPVGNDTTSLIKGSGTVRKDPFTATSANPSSDTSASTTAASMEAAVATVTEAAPDRALSTALKLKLSAEVRVHELSSTNASLRGKLQRVTADLEQAEIKIDNHEIKFYQADKMRQRAQEDLSGIAAQRNRLLHLVSDLMPEQTQLPTQAVQDTTSCTYVVSKGDCFQQTSPSGRPATRDQISTQTPAKHASTQTSIKQPQTLTQTDEHDLQIPAVRAGQGQLQELQQELQCKQKMIERQAAVITNAATEMSAQQGMVQQLRADLSARELPALLFHVRLVPTKGFKGDQFDIPHCARRLGEGGSATIYQETLCGELRATKYPKKGVKAVAALAHELCMHLRCAGPNTVSILSVGMDQIPRGPVLSANVICFSMEMATMSLKACIAQATGGFKGCNREGLVFSLDTTKLILMQITAAIQGVHRTHTLHGDVKPDNFLVFGHGEQISGVKITDFGLSQSLENGIHEIAPTADGTRGTPGWIAPEMYVQNLRLGHKHRSTVGTAADVYAAGWVFFEVLCGLSPLMFQKAKSDDSFAVGAATVAPLDSKIQRQEVNLDLEDSSTESSLGSSSTAGSASMASAGEDDRDDKEDQDSHTAGSCGSHQSRLGSIDTAAVYDASAGAEGSLDADCSPDQIMDDLHPAEDVDMVHLYPEYLLSSTRLQLLQLCQAMWARDPEARPSCEDILAQLAEL